MRGKLKSTVALGVLTFLFVLALAATAFAAPGYRNAGSFGQGTVPFESTQFAVDGTNGNVLVVAPDRQSILVFDSVGPGATQIGEFGSSTLSSPFGVAVDGTSGSVYVADAGLGRVVRFLSDGAPIPTYTVDSGYAGPAAGAGAEEVGSFASPLVVDPASGDLLVVDRGNQRVSRFDSAGAFISAIDGSGTAGGPFTNLRDLAIAPNGDLYVLDLNGQINALGEVEGTSRIERFGAGGAPLGRVGAGVADTGVSIAYDPTRELIGVATPFNAITKRPPQLLVLAGNALVDETSYAAEVNGAAAPDLAVYGPSGRLYGLTGKSFGAFEEKATVQVFEPAVVPVLTIAPPDGVTSTGARFSGTVDPDGKATEFRFEYSRDGGATWSSTPPAAAGEGEAPVPVEATVNDLVPNSSYLVRLTAEGEVSRTSASVAFQTPVAGPAAVTGSAVEIDPGSVALRGSVNPFGLQSTYYFEYGPTSAYGFRAPLDHDAPAGQGYSPVPVEETVTGLFPGAVYHFRIVATNAAGPTFGEDRTFVLGGPPARGYELVSDAEKGGSEADYLWPHAGPSGDWISFQTHTAIPGPISDSAPFFPRYLGRRGSDSWTVAGLDPPLVQSPAQSNFFFDALHLSPDGSKVVVVTPKGLAPGAADGDSHLYLKDIATGTYETIATSPGAGFFGQARTNAASGSLTVLGGNSDFSRVYFQSEGFQFEPFLGAAPYSIYEWSRGGGLRVVAEEAIGAPNLNARDPNSVSTDGSRVFYTTLPDFEIWASEDGENFRVSAPNSGGVSNEFYGASADGRYAYTWKSEGGAISRFDLETRELTQIDEGIAQQAGQQVSRDGSYVYYLDERLDSEGGTELFFKAWHEGEVDSFGSLPSGVGQVVWRASPSGRYFVFDSARNQTGFDSEGNGEIYRYDAVTGDLVCASCRTDGRPPSGTATAGDRTAEFEHWIPRVVIDSGEVFFDTPDQLVPADVNSSRDVYAFDGARQILLSSGRGSGDSRFADADEDGSDVFFVTQDRLVGKDTDQAADVYDARIGGGLPGQDPAPAVPGCTGLGCVAATPPPPPRPSLASEAPGTPKKKHRRKGCRKAHANSRVQAKKGKPRCGKAHGTRKSGRNGR